MEPMKLYLVQHGEAESKDVDPERPLTARGRADVDRLAAFLSATGVQVERVIHSGKLRARQTAERLGQAMAPHVELETSGLMSPNDSPKGFDWQSESWQRDTLIVGHLPFMARLVAHLVIDDDSQSIVSYEPGSMVCLESNQDDRWQINWMVRPALLKQQ
jgi:phosphohistidine phosphatase